MKHLPQELEVWYLIPALRRELAKICITEFSRSQRETAECLGLTESAVSQYVSAKRGHELTFNETEIKAIRHAAKKILESGANANEIIYKLTKKFKGTQSLCEFHKKHDASVPHNCNLCA